MLFKLVGRFKLGLIYFLLVEVLFLFWVFVGRVDGGACAWKLVVGGVFRFVVFFSFMFFISIISIWRVCRVLGV